MTNYALVTAGFLLELPINIWHQRLEHLECENVKKLKNHSCQDP